VGFPRIAPVRPVAERVRSGLLLANRFGVSLSEDIQSDLGVSGMGWAIRPFSGNDARGDGLAAIGYDLDGLPEARSGRTHTPLSILARTTRRLRALASCAC